VGRLRTEDICYDISKHCGEYTFRRNLIDPMANETELSTGKTTIQNMNEAFRKFKSLGIGTGGFWMPWDTHGNVGREELTERLLNSLRCGRPFNNRQQNIVGEIELLPTVWFFSECRNTIDSMKNWRRSNWKTREAEEKNDLNENENKKWSHFPITIESMLKDPSLVRPKKQADMTYKIPKSYMKGR